MRRFFLLLSLCFVLIAMGGCTPSSRQRYVIGVSQCSEDEWREQMNKEIRREALFYPEAEVDIRTSKDNNQKQIDDIRHFIRRGVDLLIISPNEADAITPIIEEAYDKGIPVVLVDRKIHSEKYTAYVGANNYDIGFQAGQYISGKLQRGGNIVEIMGLKGSTSATERHRGLMAALSTNKNIQVISSFDAGWLRQEAAVKFDSLLQRKPHDIDLVFAHNDRMAAGAYDAACERNIRNLPFVGVDALAGKGNGVDRVIQGKLDATFIYPTGGDKVMQVAMNILLHRKFNRENLLSTALVNRANARIMQMQTSHIARLDGKIEVLDEKLDTFLMRYSSQQMLLYACILILVLVATLLFIAVRAFWLKNRLNEELSRQKCKLEEQRDQLIHLSKQLEEATHAKLSFFTNVSHDFRTPLTLIADPVAQLLEIPELGERAHAMLSLVQKNVSVLLRLVNQILDFRKFENGKLDLQLSEFDLAQAMTDWTEMFRALSYKKHIRFLCSVAPSDTPYIMVADQEKMERITYNLLSNAFKFTPENGKIEVLISICQYEGEPWLNFTISDTGIGMPAHHISHIFESFYQIDVHYAGSGIGLALVKAFVEMHGGTVGVTSTEGKGTVFTIRMPMKQDGVLPDTSRNHTPEILKQGAVFVAGQQTIEADPVVPITSEKTTVLVIDDNQSVREYVCMILETAGYAVIEAANGLEGVKQATKYVPDAVICDVMMPIMDGLECCTRLKNELQTSHIPIMMLTAYSMEEQQIKGYVCGADSYLLKPFSARLLLARLQNLLDNRRRIQNFFADTTVTRREPAEDLEKGFVDKLRTLIDTHLSDPALSVEQLGDKIGLSRVQLYRKAKALTGYSPNELLRIARLKKAYQLLASTEKSIAEITYEVGFSSPSYFTKCYKEYFGENPTDFLKRKDS